MENIIRKQINLILNKWGISSHFNNVIYDKLLKDEYLLKQIQNTIECSIGEEYRKDLIK